MRDRRVDGGSNRSPMPTDPANVHLRAKFEAYTCPDEEMWLLTDEEPLTDPKGYTLHSEMEKLPRDVRRLNVVEDPRKRVFETVPWVLRECSALRQLALPDYTVSALRPGDLPEQLLELNVIGGKPCTLSSNVMLPKLQRLISPLVPLTFYAASVPNLIVLSFDGRAGGPFAEILKLQSLAGLKLFRLQATDRLAELVPLAL